jgi:hypothetical protein
MASTPEDSREGDWSYSQGVTIPGVPVSRTSPLTSFASLPFYYLLSRDLHTATLRMPFSFRNIRKMWMGTSQSSTPPSQNSLIEKGKQVSSCYAHAPALRSLFTSSSSPRIKASPWFSPRSPPSRQAAGCIRKLHTRHRTSRSPCVRVGYSSSG